MAADENPAVRCLRHFSGKDRDDIAQFDVLPHTPSLWDLVRVEAHLEARAVAFELVEDPLARDTDAAIGLGRIGKRVARLEAFQFAENA